MILILVFFCLIFSCVNESDCLSFNQNSYSVETHHVELKNLHKDYFANTAVKVGRINRKIRVFNLTMDLLKEMGSKLQSTIKGFVFTNNEYKFFPALSFKVPFCAALNANMIGMKDWVGQALDNPKCPVPKGHYDIVNIRIDESKAPPLLPEGQYRIDISGIYAGVPIGTLCWFGSVQKDPN